MIWTEKDWERMFEQAKKDGGILISKVAPPNGSLCDHKESVWEYHEKTIRKVMLRNGFHIAYETRNLVSIVKDDQRTT